MRISHLALASTIALLPFAVTACGSDDDTPGSGGSGAQGGTAGSGAGGSGADGGSGAMGGSAGTGAQGGTAGNGGTAGTGGGSCDLSGTGLAHADVTAPAAGQTVTLTSDKVWDLKGKVNVGDGSTLVIEPCTRIEGDGASLGTLVIQQGGKIMAQGTETDPILFTSALPAGSRAPGDWGGVIVLGKAPNFKISGTDLPSIEGLNPGEGLYGGNEPADNSGVMTYVRIEYSGVEIGDGNEINGLTLGSVGSGTTLHHIMVSNTLDDCFEWFGGTVNAHHLVCNNAGDDMFDMDQGFQGSVQFLFGRQIAPISDDPNGWECDSDKGGATPVSQVTASNVTLCGLGTDPANPQYGAVFRENLEGDYGNMLFKGFEASFDVRDDAGTASNPKVKVHDTTVKGVTEDIAYDEMGSADNDSGFDERAWFNGGTGNSVADPGIDCGSAGVAPNPIPATTITGGTPLATGAAGTATGFDTSATYQGGFGTENWMSAPWCDWAAN